MIMTKITSLGQRFVCIIQRFVGFTLYFFAGGLSVSSLAQYSIHHGVSLPTSDTVRALIIFCEVNYADGPCPKDLPDEFTGQWTQNPDGTRGLPANAGVYLDHEILDSPKGYITGYYHEASFGTYVLLGDYLSEVIQVPCHQIKQGLNLDQVFQIINSKYANRELLTAHGYRLQDFDRWSEAPQGLPKPKVSDGKIDLVYLIWRNNRFLNGYNTWDNSGYGVTAVRGIPFCGMKGVNTAASFNNSWGDEHGFFITIAEHLHAIFGGNHWHSGGGRGVHTFLCIPYNYGLTGQLEATMQAVCAWDRWMMRWKNPQKRFLISSLDTAFNEVNTENLTLDSLPQGGRFILRDHVKTSDAIRIKLPYIIWQKNGDVKNQYLWLEYRSFTTRFDKYINGVDNSCEDFYPDAPFGTPGLYSYIQVGKDQREGKDIYSSNPQHPNGLASWLLPLTAEGNYDYAYSYDKQPVPHAGCGSWGNTCLPFDISASKPNPFTGHSDLFRFIDSNQDGVLYQGDELQPGLCDLVGDTVIFNYHRNGDKDDAFCKRNGKTKLYIASNPAPVPVYTYATDFEFNRFYFKENDAKSSFENRTIWLNGLSIEILRENILIDGEPAIEVLIRWDDYAVDQSVRWCGNIRLSPHVFDVQKPSLHVLSGKKILLDRSESPTFHFKRGEKLDGTYWMSDKTQFTASNNAYICLDNNSSIELKNESELVLEAGAKLEMKKGSKIIIHKGSKFILQPGAEIIRYKGAKIIYK